MKAPSIFSICIFALSMPSTFIKADVPAGADATTNSAKSANNLIAISKPLDLVNRVSPPFSLRSSQRQNLTYMDQVGQKTLVFLIDGSEPLFAANGDQELKSLQAHFAQRELLVVNVLNSSSRTTEFNSPFQMLDEGNSFRKSFGIADTAPSLVIIDQAGFVRIVEAFPTGINAPVAALAAAIENSLKSINLFPDKAPAIFELKVGQEAPDFIVADMNGKTVRQSYLEGKENLVLTFFPKCFTGKCMTHLSSLRDAYKGLKQNDTEVWAVSVDAADGEKGQIAFARELELPFRLLPDVGRNVSILYGAAHSPNQLSSRMTIFIDKKGVIRWIDKQIIPQTHGGDVLERVKGTNRFLPIQ